MFLNFFSFEYVGLLWVLYSWAKVHDIDRRFVVRNFDQEISVPGVSRRNVAKFVGGKGWKKFLQSEAGNLQQQRGLYGGQKVCGKAKLTLLGHFGHFLAFVQNLRILKISVMLRFFIQNSESGSKYFWKTFCAGESKRVTWVFVTSLFLKFFLKIFFFLQFSSLHTP